MSGWLLPALVLVAALAATYVCCLRPMRNGVCHRSPVRTPAADDLNRQLRQAHAERDRLRTQ
ncbi:hypothetical protein SAMN04515665_12617 [Blastococcus sp. DSM 46786]|uniref:hypothetical protein n=1 Tax=Blastococcus sp. DSM 46786 TaxID=1798227 RepID=UPI0008CABF5A|nr:hypothetical protein [Blastococcus sp. DSM 46786]SEM01159.1 hypothetical protein SAMN04515665_12617 [Blastococcus sp. DSM 46786]